MVSIIANSGVLLLSCSDRGFYSILGVSWFKAQIKDASSYGFSLTKDNTGTINVYKEGDGSNLKIQNKTGVNIIIQYLYFGGRS